MTTLWLVWQVVCWVWHTAITLAVWWVLLSVCLMAWMIVVEQEGDPGKHSWRMLWRHWWAREIKTTMQRDCLPRWAAEEIVRYRALMDALRVPVELVLGILFYLAMNYGEDTRVVGDGHG
jgi:hypothetical protein